jgi:hypothetical protein
MKHILRTLLFLSILLLGLGFYIKNSKDYSQGQLLIGIAVVIMAVIIMPLFIYSRYKNKDLSSFKSVNPKERGL